MIINEPHRRDNIYVAREGEGGDVRYALRREKLFPPAGPLNEGSRNHLQCDAGNSTGEPRAPGRVGVSTARRQRRLGRKF